MNNHQKSSFHPLGDFLNSALALLGLGLRKSPSGQKLNFVNRPYLCKGLYYFLKNGIRGQGLSGQSFYAKVSFRNNSKSIFTNGAI